MSCMFRIYQQTYDFVKGRTAYLRNKVKGYDF